MSLATETIFIKALSENQELMHRLGQNAKNLPRLYSTAIPIPDEDFMNAPVPYVIVSFDGLTNDSQTKDEPYEGIYDQVSIGIEVAGKNIGELHILTQMVRDTILSYMRENDTPIEDYQFSAQSINYDSIKQCYWQVLSYVCDVLNTNDDE